MLESAPEIFRESLAVSLATLILTDGEVLPTLLDIISEEKFKKDIEKNSNGDGLMFKRKLSLFIALSFLTQICVSDIKDDLQDGALY